MIEVDPEDPQRPDYAVVIDDRESDKEFRQLHPDTSNSYIRIHFGDTSELCHWETEARWWRYWGPAADLDLVPVDRARYSEDILEWRPKK